MKEKETMINDLKNILDDIILNMLDEWKIELMSSPILCKWYSLSKRNENIPNAMSNDTIIFMKDSDDITVAINKYVVSEYISQKDFIRYFKIIDNAHNRKMEEIKIEALQDFIKRFRSINHEK